MADSDRVRYHTARETVPEEHRHHYDAIAESRGGVRGPFSVLLNSPELAGRVGHLGAYVRFESELPDADRELTILATARAFDCAFEWAAHEPIAREAGVSGATIDHVADSGPVDELPDREARLVSYVRELIDEHAVSDATFEAARDRYGESGVTELTGTIGYYAMLACVLNALEVVPDADRPQLP
ncbi:carboxymuconolactone decarboxylase family protein [haloarchaeon 3A1-DGR]|nr:carboxymuconolactone decarboxylase family protein [haloarchaeon 3A1-DGR]